MDNKIFGYNVKYTTDGVLQPYFKNESARDTFMESCFVKQLNETGLSINFLSGLEFEFVVNVDITEIENINFVKVVYNSKEYFGYITDFAMVSVNRSIIYVSRAPLYEVIDFHSYFNLFYCNRKTTYNFVDCNTSDNIVFNNPLKLKCSATSFTTHNVKYIVFLNYDIPIIKNPSASTGDILGIDVKEFYRHSNIQENYMVFVYEGDEGYIDTLASALSPYILSYYKFDLIFSLSDSSVFSTVEASINAKIHNTVLTVGGKLITNMNAVAYKYKPVNVNQFGKIEICTGIDQKCTIEMYPYFKNGENYLTVWIYPVLDLQDCGYFIYPHSEFATTFASDKRNNCFFLLQNSKMSYVMSSEAVWSSQNQYYNEITDRKVKQIRGLSQAEYQMNKEQQIWGLYGDITGAISGAVSGGVVGGAGVAGANLAGGVAGALATYGQKEAFGKYVKATGDINSSALEDIRNLQAENDKAIPQGVGSYGNCGVTQLFSEMWLTIFEYNPLENSLNPYLKYVNTHGMECYCVESTPTYDIIDGKFSYVANGLFQNSKTKPINNMFAAYFQDILKKDFIYEVYQ